MLPADTPKLPKWPFLVGDAALLGLAWLIGDQSRNPFAGTPLISIVVCVLCGAILAAIPFLADYARKQDEALDERQRALEVLSRTVSASAEQISIAANGLHEIAELAQRNLKAAEQLPARLQEKVSAIKIQAEAPREARETRDHEKEELKKEVARLRAADGERLQAATDKLIQATAQLSKLAAAHPEAVRAGEPVRSVSTEAPPAPAPAPEVAATLPPSSLSQEAAAATDSTTSAASEAPPPPKRARKSKPDTPAPVPAPTPEAITTPAPDIPPASKAEPEPAPIPAAEIPEVVPVAPDSRAPIEPPSPAEVPAPAATPLSATSEPSASEPAPIPAPASVPAVEAARPERKRAPRKPKAEAPAPITETTTVKLDDEPALNLGNSASEPESTTAAAATMEKSERSVSSDGATRLLVTAYIGIGNRLFIRGSGPGLSWDKGLPLQFVSIGKWRWETNDATTPVQFKLYKNDDSECVSLGTQTLDPGQQEEVTASF